jgi:uncharacterized protein
MPRVRVEAPCHPTESAVRIESALRNLFPDLVIERANERVAGTTIRVDRLRELIRNQKIRDTARGQLLAGRRGDRTTIRLSKQAAYAGLVNFAVGSPLGDILVEIEDPDLSTVIDYVAESTVEPRVTPSARNEGT